MKTLTFTTKAPKSGRTMTNEAGEEVLWSIDITVDQPETIEELRSLFPDDVIIAKTTSAIVINRQNAIRTMAENGETDEAIVAAQAVWELGASTGGGMSTAKIVSNFDSMTPEAQQALIAQLTAKANG